MVNETIIVTAIICSTIIILILGSIYLSNDYYEKKSSYSICLSKCVSSFSYDNTLKLECMKNCNNTFQNLTKMEDKK